MIMEAEVKEMKGVLEEFKKNTTTTGKQNYKCLVDGKTFTWWHLEDAESSNLFTKVPCEVEVLYEEAENKQNPEYPFRNVKNITMIGEVKKEQLTIDKFKDSKSEDMKVLNANNVAMELAKVAFEQRKSPKEVYAIFASIRECVKQEMRVEDALDLLSS